MYLVTAQKSDTILSVYRLMLCDIQSLYDFKITSLPLTLGHHHPRSGKKRKRQKIEAKTRLVPRKETRREDGTRQENAAVLLLAAAAAGLISILPCYNISLYLSDKIPLTKCAFVSPQVQI